MNNEKTKAVGITKGEARQQARHWLEIVATTDTYAYGYAVNQIDGLKGLSLTQ